MGGDLPALAVPAHVLGVERLPFAAQDHIAAGGDDIGLRIIRHLIGFERDIADGPRIVRRCFVLRESGPGRGQRQQKCGNCNRTGMTQAAGRGLQRGRGVGVHVLPIALPALNCNGSIIIGTTAQPGSPHSSPEHP